MKIEIASLRLVGCGPFDDVTLNFCDNDGKPKKTILLAGANGSGKTTVLDVIVAMMENFYGMSSNSAFLGRDSFLQLDLVMDAKSFSFYRGEKPSDAILRDDFISRDMQMENFFIDQEGDTLLEWNKLKNTKTAQVLIDIYREGHVLSKSNQPPTIIYFPYQRRMNALKSDSIHQEHIDFKSVFRIESPKQFKGSLSSYLIWLEYSETEEYEKIISYLNKINIGKRFSVNRKLMQAVAVLDSGQQHTLDRLSSGEQNILIILLELIRRLTHGSIVLIDEVENHLHPAYQYKLIYALQKLQEEFNFQLIMTTHSLDVLKAVGPGNTLFLTDFSRMVPEPKL